MTNKKFKVVTLGCRTNQYEAEAFRSQLELAGYVAAGENEAADLCIVNTCTVTASADSHSRHAIRDLVRHNPGAKIAVTGCLAESLPSIEGVTHIVPNAQKESLLKLVEPEEEFPEFAINSFEGHTRAFVKVQDGCNSYCTYCIIPYVRGRSRSRPIAEIVREVETLIQSGYKEIVLTGINIGDFEGEGGEKLADLVRIVDKIPGVERLRVSSIDPDEVDDNLTDAIIQGRATCPSMHIVLQSGSNVTLKRMNRKYTRQIFLQTVERLKKARPGFTFTTDVIVGFPGETEADFEETLQVIKETKFAKVHMFPYSPRKRTRAALYPNQIAPHVIQERKQRVLRLAEEVAYNLRGEFVGQTLSVLRENGGMGHTDNFLPVVNLSGPPNTLVKVELTENTPEGLLGHVI
jgi:threonylcarbamoyladenosine tRNA methylthiotransferase MtaB